MSAIEDGTIYFSIDIETSGSVPHFFNMISLGAFVVRPQNGKLEPGASFYVEIKPDFDGFDPEAQEIHKITVEHLQEHGEESGEAMRRFDRWVRQQLEPGDRAVFVGHNAPFDWAFVLYYFEMHKIENPFGYKALDTKALAMGKLGISWWDANKGILQYHYPNLEPPPPELVHRADHDARYQADILCALLNP